MLQYVLPAGMDDPYVNPCPVGYFCPTASEPELCPPGTMRPNVSAASIDECYDCTPGFYCPNDTLNIKGIPCEEHFECPAGSALPADCRSGHYCGPETGYPPICPAGYVCYNSTGLNYDRCLLPTYCPEGSNITYLCPLGYKVLNHGDFRTSMEDSCRICPVGTYSNDSTLTYCMPCPAGFYCPAGTAHYLDNPCPVGHYCPQGTPVPEPCPAGTYLPYMRAEAEPECLQCKAGAFNDLKGQEKCKPCGGFADSNRGSDTCECRGKFRFFQGSNGACLCETGYIYYNETDMLEVDGNDKSDCQPIPYPLCSTHEVRLSSDGTCADPDLYDCVDICAGYTGELKSTGR